MANYANVADGDQWELDGKMRSLATKVVASGDIAAQKRLFTIVDTHADTSAAGDMAHALVGEREATPNPKRAAAAPVVAMLAA
jgi:hypothetical protein